MKKLSLFFIFGLVLSGCSVQSGLTLSSSNSETKIVAVGDGYCGASEGSRITAGDFILESFLQGEKVDELLVGPLTVVSGEPHDGLDLLPIQFNGQDLYRLAQYETCNSESVRLFTVDTFGKIHAIQFIKNEMTLNEVSTDYEGTVGFRNEIFSFCPYNNISGEVICDLYQSNGENLEYVSTNSYPLEDYEKGY